MKLRFCRFQQTTMQSYKDTDVSTSIKDTIHSIVTSPSFGDLLHKKLSLSQIFNIYKCCNSSNKQRQKLNIYTFQLHLNKVVVDRIFNLVLAPSSSDHTPAATEDSYIFFDPTMCTFQSVPIESSTCIHQRSYLELQSSLYDSTNTCKHNNDKNLLVQSIFVSTKRCWTAHRRPTLQGPKNSIQPWQS